jgi:hypothetical protein
MKTIVDEENLVCAMLQNTATYTDEDEPRLFSKAAIIVPAQRM